MIQKILVFEFITGGGFSQQALPESLEKEGLMMLKALLDELAILENIQLTVILDWRISSFALPNNSQLITVSKSQSIYDLLPPLIEKVDLVWPIAPEMEGELQKITQLIEQKSKGLLNSFSSAVAICSDKLATLDLIEKQGVAVIKSTQLDVFTDTFEMPWVIKAKDGAGCLNTHYIANQQDYLHCSKQIKNKADYLIQRYIKGDALSLSCLFRGGEAWLLCCNKQRISIVDGKFELHECLVNINITQTIIYQGLINKVASSIVGLYGYVGIDIIQPEWGQPLVLEINPRLTTSYVGINQAIGFNVAKAIIEMSAKIPSINKTANKQVSVLIEH